MSTTSVPIRPADYETIGSRLSWLIRDTWAAEERDQIFVFLETLSRNAFTAREWFPVVTGWADEQPSAAMIAFICEQRPAFTQWVMLGGTLPVIA